MYLGVDGGGTKTAFALIDEKGTLLSYCEKPTCYYLELGFAGFEQILNQGIAELLHGAQLSLDDLRFSFLGLPGYGERLEDHQRLQTIVARTLKSDLFKCGNDAEAGWAGSLACQPGVNVVAGTGTIGFGRDSAGTSARAGGWGEFCGDEGSAYWLGKRILSLFGKQADGRLEVTPLYHQLRSHLGLTRDLDLLSLVYDGFKDQRTQVAALAQVLFRAAEQGDPHAILAYKEAAREVSLIARSIIGQLEFAVDQAITVSYSGGVFSAQDWMLKPFAECLGDLQVNLAKPLLSPVLGAALYALLLSLKPKETQDLVSFLQEQNTRLIERR